MTRNEKYFLRRFAKVLAEEEKDQYYWFDIDGYLEEVSRLNLNPRSLREKVELVAEDHERIPSEKTITRILGYFNGEKELDRSGKLRDKSITIETAKLMGRALCDGNPYGFLIQITPSNTLMILKQAEEIWG